MTNSLLNFSFKSVKKMFKAPNHLKSALKEQTAMENSKTKRIYQQDEAFMSDNKEMKYL